MLENDTASAMTGEKAVCQMSWHDGSVGMFDYDTVSKDYYFDIFQRNDMRARWHHLKFKK